jgi:transposase
MSGIHHISSTKTKITFIWCSDHWESFRCIVTIRKEPPMDEVEQGFNVKYFFIKGWCNNKITAELQTTFHDSALSSSAVKRWIRKFKNGDFSCDDDSRPGRPMSILGQVLQRFLDRYPFSSARVISRHFHISPSTVKEILRRKLRLKKPSRRWFPHLLSHDQRKLRVDG